MIPAQKQIIRVRRRIRIQTLFLPHRFPRRELSLPDAV